ncbi:MAG: hypothetical protein IKJ50_02330, partial [Clostridia bacterium]|nr:hypothetical protein [Clostridia bacterium]
PAKYDGTFSKKIFQKAHDYFNFKKLYLESIIKVLFTFLSIACVVGGILMATVGNTIWAISKSIEYAALGISSGWIFTTYITYFFAGIGIAVLGPVVLRLVYEGFMMFIILVKNVVEINNKTKKE